MFPFDPFAALLPKGFRGTVFFCGLVYMVGFFAVQEALGDPRLMWTWFATAIPATYGLTAAYYWLKTRGRPSAVRAWFARLKATAARNPGWTTFHLGSFVWVALFGLAFLAPFQKWSFGDLEPLLLDIVSYGLLATLAVAVVVGAAGRLVRRAQ